jgi:hypothetical protein
MEDIKKEQIMKETLFRLQIHVIYLLSESRSDGAELDVGVDDLGIGGLALDLRGLTGRGGAGTTSNTGLGCVAGGGVGGVEPEHLRGVVVPNGEDENHTLSQSLRHRAHTTMSLEGVGVTEEGLLGGAEVVGDGVEIGEAGEGGERVGDGLAVLDVEATDFGEGARSGVVVGDELGDDGEFGGSVDRLASAVEGSVTHTEGVEVTTIGIANTIVTGGDGAVFAGAASLAGDGAGVRGVGGGHGVGLPDIHLIAAGTEVTSTGVGVVGRWFPALRVGLGKEVYMR